MKIWQPPVHESDALRAAIIDYLRNTAAQVFLKAGSGARSLGREELVISDGRRLAIDLVIAPEDVQTFANRSAIVFAVQGHAAETANGYTVAGRIVLDKQTLAFLLIDISTLVVNEGRRF